MGTFEIFYYDWGGNLIKSHLTEFDEGNIIDIHHTPDKLITVGDDAYCYESNDRGISWRRFGIEDLDELNVYYHDGNYYTADYTGFYRSIDGDNWEEISNRGTQTLIKGRNGEFALQSSDDLAIYFTDTEEIKFFDLDETPSYGQFDSNGNYYYIDNEGLKFVDIENGIITNQSDLGFLTEGRHRLKMIVNYSGGIVLVETHSSENSESWYSLDKGVSFQKGSTFDDIDFLWYQFFVDPSAIFISFEEQLFFSTDDFRSFSEIDVDIPDSISIRSLSLDSEGFVYLSTNIFEGIYRSTEAVDLGMRISGCVFRDSDNDCIQSGELLLPQQELKFIDQSGQARTVVVGDSPFEISLPLADYTVEHEFNSNLWDPCQDPYFVDQNNLQKIEIGLQPLVDCSILEGQFGSMAMRRCFDNRLNFNVCNTGTQITAPGTTIEITLGENLIFKESSVPLIDQQGSTYIFDGSDISPFDCQRINMTYEVSCDAELGDLHCITGTVRLPESCNGSNYVNSVENCMMNIGSYDPNDMHALVDNEWAQTKDIELETEYVDYLVRFQNTGTDTAFTVRVVSELSSHLDLEGIDILDFSHDFIYQKTNEGLIEMIFDDILLPDSTTNLIKSQGFVKFRIPVKEALVEGNEIQSVADIFFDFNDPVTTNEVLLTTNVLTNVKEVDVPDFYIYPNPVTEVLHIETEQDLKNGSWTIFNLLGTEVSSGLFTDSNTISTLELERGNYIFSAEVNGFKIAMKLVKL